MKRMFLMTAVSVVLALGLGIGCAPVATPSPTATAPPPAASPTPTEVAKPRGTITIAVTQDFFYMDPHQTIMMADSTMHSQIHEALVYYDAQLQIHPGLAASWEMVSPTEWVFHLREGVKFHNGEPFNADSVVYNTERILGDWGELRWTLVLGYLDHAEKINDYTVKLVTTQPDPVFLAHLTCFWMVSPRAVEEVGNDNYGGHPVGTGPYRLVERVKDDHVTLTANLDYWGELPAIETVIYKVIPETVSRIAALQTGEVDIAPITVDSFKVIDDSPNLTAVAIESAGTPWVFFEAESPQNPDAVALKDVRVRQALNYAVDVDSIAENTFLGFASRQGSNIPPLFWGHDPSIGPYPYDPEKAKELLAEAGYPELTLNLETPIGLMQKSVEVAEAIANDLEKVGVHAPVIPVEVGVLFAKREEVPTQAAPLHLIPWGQAAMEAIDKLYYPFHCEAPTSTWCDPHLDELIEASNVTMDPDERKEILFEIQRIVHDQAGVVFLYTEPFVFGYNDRVIGFEPRVDEKILAYGCSLAE